LERKKLPCVVVSQTEIASDDDTPADCIQERLEDRFCVHIWCLNEDGMLCVFDSGEKGRILGGIDAGVVRGWADVSHIFKYEYKILLTSPWLSIHKRHRK
jgi:hypothetical protein